MQIGFKIPDTDLTCDCSSKSSQMGIETTRIFLPCPSNSLPASTAFCNSDPIRTFQVRNWSRPSFLVPEVQCRHFKVKVSSSLIGFDRRKGQDQPLMWETMSNLIYLLTRFACIESEQRQLANSLCKDGRLCYPPVMRFQSLHTPNEFQKGWETIYITLNGALRSD